MLLIIGSFHVNAGFFDTNFRNLNFVCKLHFLFGRIRMYISHIERKNEGKIITNAILAETRHWKINVENTVIDNSYFNPVLRQDILFEFVL